MRLAKRITVVTVLALGLLVPVMAPGAGGTPHRPVVAGGDEIEWPSRPMTEIEWPARPV
ncbi:hypothetical protein [Streptomyces sp. NPDC089915]|uniref:hypothetical protein n=1 Tax=Streptomyces sp. NPDC089915 TaxID=3155186 RepID=UPI003448B696